ncbi:MAG: TatD family hydrolase [Phycisphaerales bacterium]|nr:TatD family hydrolase [Phycisphaerales bacterium]
MIDTHCHLTFPDYRDKVDQTLADARAAGVTGCITISTTTQDAPSALAIARHHERVWCSAGVHPLYADQGPHDWKALAFIARDPKCIAWGELGLDNHYERPRRPVQQRVLEEQLGLIESWSREGLAKPVILHCRKAFDDLIPVLRRSSLPPERFVFHCFTGDSNDVRKCLEFGAMVSFTGVVTFANAVEVAAAAKLVPDERIMVETDAPFLSPEPVRSRWPNRPANVVHVARFLAKLRGVDANAFEQVLDANAERFFGLGGREPSPPGS